MGEILLSYSTINELINCPHTYINKLLGLPRFRTQAMTEGSNAHRVIQGHLSGKLFDERLKDITLRFPIVEKADRDEQTHFTIPFNEKYFVHGYIDGSDYDKE